MFFSQDTLLSLLAIRHELYVQLGLVDRHVAAMHDGPMFSTPLGEAVIMSDLIETLEEQIGNVNRQIAQFRGPIRDRAVPAAPVVAEAVLAADPV